MFCGLEAVLHALKQKFQHVTKPIVQSDNAKNLSGKQTKLLLPYVCSAAGLKLVAYYRNEAQCGKDVCDTHFSQQQTQVDAYLVQGDGGRKVSTPKQLAVSLMSTPVGNTSALLVKPNFQAKYRSNAIPSIPGIPEFYAAQYVTSSEKQQIQFHHSLGQKVPSACVPIPSCPAHSLIAPVMFNSDSDGGYRQARKNKNQYRKGSKDMSQREMQWINKLREDEEAWMMIREIYAQYSE